MADALAADPQVSGEVSGSRSCHHCRRRTENLVKMEWVVVMMGVDHGVAATRSGRIAVASRLWMHRQSTRFYRPNPRLTTLSWIAGERIAVGSMPTGESLPSLAEQGVTHVVNCRARPQTWVSQDLSAERAIFGNERVAHAPLWDTRQFQPAAVWAAAAQFAATTVAVDPHAGVLIHCQQGRCRSVMVAYAVLRLRGHTAENAADLIRTHRREALLVPLYIASVDQWLASTTQTGETQMTHE